MTTDEQSPDNDYTLTESEVERIYSPIGNESAYPELPGVVAEIVAEHVDATARRFGTLGWNACATAMRALIAAGTGDTVSVFDIEAMLTAAEDEAEADDA